MTDDSEVEIRPIFSPEDIGEAVSPEVQQEVEGRWAKSHPETRHDLSQGPCERTPWQKDGCLESPTSIMRLVAMGVNPNAPAPRDAASWHCRRSVI